MSKKCHRVSASVSGMILGHRNEVKNDESFQIVFNICLCFRGISLPKAEPTLHPPESGGAYVREYACCTEGKS